MIFPTRNAPEIFSQISVKLKTLNFVVGNLTLLSAIAAHMAVKLWFKLEADLRLIYDDSQKNISRYFWEDEVEIDRHRQSLCYSIVVVY